MLLMINKHLSSSGKQTAILWNFLSLPLTALATIEGQSSTPFLKDSVLCPRMTYPQRTLVTLGSHWFTKHGILFLIREQDIESVLINPRKEMHQWGWTPPWRFIKVYGKYLTSLTHKAVIPFHWCQVIFVRGWWPSLWEVGQVSSLQGCRIILNNILSEALRWAMGVWRHGHHYRIFDE